MPFIADWLEPFDEVADGEAALHIHLRKDARSGLINRRCGNVGSQYLDPPATPPARVVAQLNGERISLLSRRAARAPYAQDAILLGGMDRRQDLTGDHVENLKVPKKAAFIVQQRIDHIMLQSGLTMRQQLGRQFVYIGQAVSTEHRLQRCLHPPGSIFGQDLAGARFQQGGKNAGNTA